MRQAPETQHALFCQGIDALGGQTAAAHELDVSLRTLTRLVAGKMPLHDGYLRDMAAALMRRADLCRNLEKRLNPLFSGNLTEDQAREDGRRTRWIRNTDLVCTTCRYRDGHSPDCPLRDEPWPLVEVPA